MNANEPCPNCGEYHSCTDLIHQQQAENEELKSKLSKVEEIILDSVNRGKMIGYAEGLMKGKQIGKQV